ncbi:ThuA domain-containing protein [Candidatus Latescibacterota bacterium]
MALFNKKRNRRLLQTGTAALATGAFASPDANAAIQPKAPGETKIVAFMGGDYGHNSIPLEMHIREIFETKKNWRIIFVRASRFFTPGLISDADLLILSRHSRPDDIGWRTEGLVDSMETGEQLWNDENVNAIIDNVRTRGMGFMALHNTIVCRRTEITDLLDIKPIMHNEVQPLWVHNLNGEHPITKGVGKFYINIDEQFAAIIKSHSTTSLFETSGIHDKRHAVGGWCLESGRGRIVGLLPGHAQYTYRVPEYQTIIWRSAHWAMKRDIPPYPKEKNTLYL